MAPSKLSKIHVERIKRREKIKRETPEQREARLENARRYSQTRLANETWEHREERLARNRYVSEQKKIRNLRKKHEMELLRKMQALNLTIEDQRQAFRERERLNAKMAECEQRIKKIEEELQKNRLRIIEANKEAKSQEKEVEIEIMNQGNQAKQHEGGKDFQKDINLFQAINLINESEISKYVNNLLQNCPPSPSSYSHILKIYGYDSINSVEQVLKNTTSYCSENQIGRSPLGVSGLYSGGLIQQCYSSDPMNIQSSSKLEIKCEVRESDEDILKAYLKLGIVKNKPLEPSVGAEGGSLHGYSQSATGCELSSYEHVYCDELLNNSASDLTGTDSGEEMVIASLSSYEHANSDELLNNSASDNTDPNPGEEMVIASLSYENVNSYELLNNSVSDSANPNPGDEMVIASLSPYEHVNSDELLNNSVSDNTDADHGEEMVIALDPANILLAD